MQTVMITGCSSGFGLETARHFLDQGYAVIATMRNPDASLLPASEHLRILPLDVTEADSIASAVSAAGPVDALVNNAGIGWLAPFEATPEAIVRDVFETNTFGLMAMIRAVLPGMRARGTGVIVNVTSSVTMKPLPLLPVYTASKAAVNAFTECLALELAPLGIRSRIVLPGRAPDTSFASNAMSRMGIADPAPADYQPFIDGVMAAFMAEATEEMTEPDHVVQAIWRAVTDPDCPLHLPAGHDAEALAA
ncbi:SDR family oxidoreductase [Algicella marina]|uniref:SDR family NAD(P)-dependent oxidoreductase n=1 Tax=Algicella marina TaxID=2683284 RepID=A0A6P1SWS8_9RHOB|nr:SDR family oxidoreductase [Algicella marina]QHQ33975.1 SDR family NAD(P)-dependent oxidoreductase [Algicella marina]